MTVNQVDRAVGRRIRDLRRGRGKTQSELAVAIGIRYGQIREHEAGLVRPSPLRLWAIAAALDVGVARFFDDIGPAAPGPAHSRAAGEDGPVGSLGARRERGRDRGPDRGRGPI